MPVPHSLADLSTEETINSPQGGDSVGGQVDDYFRGHAVIMARDLAPALKATGTAVTPVGAVTATDAQAAIAQLDTAIATKQPTGDYATNASLAAGLAGKQPLGSYAPASGSPNYAPPSGSVNYVNTQSYVTNMSWNGSSFNMAVNGTPVGTLYSTQNFDPATKANAGAQVRRNSGVVQFGAAVSGGDALDIPDPYCVVGVSWQSTYLYLRGATYINQ